MTRRLVCLFFCALFSGLNIAAPVLALSEKQKHILERNIGYYDVSACKVSAPSSENTGAVGPVYMMGDSITAGAKIDLENEFTSQEISIARIDGVPSRSFISKGSGSTNGLEALDDGKEDIKQASIVILALGTNGEDATGKSSNFKTNAQKALDKIKTYNPSAKTYWVNLFSDASKIPHKNDYNHVIAGLPGVTIIDADKANISLSDKIHPDASGYKTYAKVVANAIKAGGGSANSSTEEGSCSCVVPGAGVSQAGSSVIANIDAFSPDSDAEKMFEEEGVPQIRKFMPLYQKAAQEEGVPLNWEILAGLHWTETNFGRKWESNALGYTGPFQQGPGELKEYRNEPAYGEIKTLVSDSGSVIPVSGGLSNDQFVVLARLALHRWVNQALGADYDKLKAAPIGFEANVDANNPFWKIMSRWNHGAEGYQGFTGYNNTNYKMPQPITGYGAGGMWNKPGVATTYYLLKKNGIGGVGGCAATEDGAGNLQAISGTRTELVKRLLDNPKLRLGNYGNPSTQRSDIESGITDDLLKLMIAAAEQSGVALPVNALKTDHEPGTAHEAGKAVDIGYYGNGNANHTADGDKMFVFLYKNRAALKIKQLIWKYPPDGYKCVNSGRPVSCESYGRILDDHYHHIHAGL